MISGCGSAPCGPGKYPEAACAIGHGDAFIAHAERVQALEEIIADLFERGRTPGIFRREQKLGHALVGGSTHVGPALAEWSLCTLGEREHAICRSLPCDVPALCIVFGDDLHRLQDFAQVGAVGHDVSRIPQRLEVKCRIGEEKSPWGDRGRGTWWRWRSTAALGCLHGGSEASGGQTGPKECPGGGASAGGVAYGHLHLLRSGNFIAPRKGAPELI